MEPARFLKTLQDNGVGFFSGVPDSLLKEFCACVTASLPPARHVIAANEGAAVALAAGYHLATGRFGCVYLQNSGLGNAVNPLVSIADREVYAIPLLLVVGWRGEPGVKDEPQHVKQGRVTPAILDCMEIPHILLDRDSDAAQAVGEAVRIMRAESRPVALVVRKDAFEAFAGEKPAAPQAGRLSREEAIAAVTAALSPETVVVATTGFTSRELCELRTANGDAEPRDFLTVGGMGHTVSIAAGIAIGQPERPVVCLDGDGSVLMHMGALPVIGAAAPQNLVHVVLNNGVHDSVGGQPTAGLSTDFQGIARASGYRLTLGADGRETIAQAMRQAGAQAGPVFVEIRIRPGARKDLGRPKSTPVENKTVLMRRIGSLP